MGNVDVYPVEKMWRRPPQSDSSPPRTQEPGWDRGWADMPLFASLVSVLPGWLEGGRLLKEG